MSFLSIAEPFIAMQIPVFPLAPGKKFPATSDGCKDATLDPAKIAEWNAINPSFNVGIAALAGGEFCFLEFDMYGIKSAAEEMGQTVPQTRMQKSGAGGAHLIFRHTERSRELGNRKANRDGREWFSFRADNLYLVGAGSVHPNGNFYKTVRDVEPTPVPDWICDFVEKHAEVPKPKSIADAISVSEDFDFDNFLDFYDISGHEEGDWFICDECPVAGYRHQGSTKTGFFYDGNSFGFHCFAQGCEGSQMSVGQVIGHLNKEKGVPYRGKIWAHDDDDLEGVVMLDDDEELPEPEVQTKVIVDADELVSFINDPVVAEVPAVVKEPEAKKEEKPKLRMLDGVTCDDWTQGIVVQNAATVVTTKLEWLWLQKVPKGKMTFFTGLPGCCKSMVALDVVAHVTTGKDFPDCKNENPPCRVLIAAAEDDPSDTLVPRLIAAGADLTMVEIIEGSLIIPTADKKKKKRGKLDLKKDSRLLLAAIKANPDIKLLVLDPITSFLGDVDTNKDKDIRPIVDEITKLCIKSGMTIISIIHSNKRSDVDAVQKVSGAGALGASVRAVWTFSRDTDNKDLHHMAWAKGNFSKDYSGIDYTIEEAQVVLSSGETVGIPHILWGAKSELSADELLKAARNNKDTKDTKTLIAIALIRTMMPCMARKAYEKADKEEGISEETMKKAKARIEGVLTRRHGGAWWWYMPDNPPAIAKEERELTVDMV
jgi:hypothetical protein